MSQSLHTSTRNRVWALSWPAMISGLSVPFLGLVDTSIVGRLSTPDALCAVALGSWLFDLCYWSFGFLRMGTTGLVAQAKEREPDSLRVLLARPLIIGMVAGILLILLGHPLSHDLLSLMAGVHQTEVSTVAAEYFKSRVWGGPAVLMNYACLGWLLGTGRAKLALASQLTLNVLNTVLSLWWGPIYGVAGVGAASAVAQWITALGWCALIWLRLSPPFSSQLLFKELKKKKPWQALAALNFDLWLRTALLLGCFGLMNSHSARFGALTLSVNAILLHLQSLQAFILDGFAHGIEVVIGEQLGRGDRKGYRYALRSAFELAMVSALVISMIYFAGASTLIKWLTHHETVHQAVQPYLIWAIISPIISAPCFILDGVMIGATQSSAMRRGMIWSALWFALCSFTCTSLWGNHGLWAAFLSLMICRAITLMPHAHPSVIIPVDHSSRDIMNRS